MKLRGFFGRGRELADQTDTARREDIADSCARLTGDELEVVARIADRLVMGRRQYGPLRLDTDKRDWNMEALAEVLDLAVYGAIRLVVAGRKP